MEAITDENSCLTRARKRNTGNGISVVGSASTKDVLKPSLSSICSGPPTGGLANHAVGPWGKWLYLRYTQRRYGRYGDKTVRYSKLSKELTNLKIKTNNCYSRSK